MHYDAVGNLLSISDSKGTTTFSYDKDNRLIQKTYPDMTTVLYTYDKVGNRLSISDSMGITRFVYNELDQIISVTDPFGMTVGYSYNPLGLRTALKYPGNRIVSYTYDELGRISTVQDWSGITTTYEYDAAGRLVKKTMGNGSIVTYGYDDTGRLISKEDRDKTGNVIVSYNYTLDSVGNRTSMTMTQPLVPKMDMVDDNFTHNEGNQVTSHNSATFTYDGNGNRTARIDGTVTTQYAYNYDDMLTMVTKGADTYEYNYNSDGMRLSSIINGIETRYLLD